MEKEKPMSKQKAKDLALWKTFQERKQNRMYKVAGNEDSGYYIIPISKPVKSIKDASYAKIEFKAIKEIRTDTEMLPHWEKVTGLFTVADGEILRFILRYQIPLEKFIRYELASRGYDEAHDCCGFEKAEEVWMR